MKKRFMIVCIILVAFQYKQSMSQSFRATFPDTIKYGEAIQGSALSCWINNYVTNLTDSAIIFDVVRVQDDIATPGWTSSFCFVTCQIPEIDSIRVSIAPNDSVNIAVHFIITDIPDSGTILMKIKNALNPAEVIYQRFYGISQMASGINSSGFIPSCSGIFPSPVRSGSVFSIRLSNMKTTNDAVLNIYSVYGNKVSKELHLNPGINQLNCSLSSGIYFYTVSADGSPFFTGKLIVVE
jgi:hypothetical protein